MSFLLRTVLPLLIFRRLTTTFTLTSYRVTFLSALAEELTAALTLLGCCWRLIVPHMRSYRRQRSLNLIVFIITVKVRSTLFISPRRCIQLICVRRGPFPVDLLPDPIHYEDKRNQLRQREGKTHEPRLSFRILH